jgi:hypothetical protein
MGSRGAAAPFRGPRALRRAAACLTSADAGHFRPKDRSGSPPDVARNGEQDFRHRKRSNDTRTSTTDPDARLYREGPDKEAKLCFMGHALMEVLLRIWKKRGWYSPR